MIADVDLDILGLKQLLSGFSTFYPLFHPVVLGRSNYALNEKELMLHLFEGRASI